MSFEAALWDCPIGLCAVKTLTIQLWFFRLRLNIDLVRCWFKCFNIDSARSKNTWIIRVPIDYVWILISIPMKSVALTLLLPFCCCLVYYPLHPYDANNTHTALVRRWIHIVFGWIILLCINKSIILSTPTRQPKIFASDQFPFQSVYFFRLWHNAVSKRQGQAWEIRPSDQHSSTDHWCKVRPILSIEEKKRIIIKK